MEERKLSVMDVLKMNLSILEGMRIPVGERQIWEAVQGVMQNERACIQAMEEQARKAQEVAETETEAQDEQRDDD